MAATDFYTAIKSSTRQRLFLAARLPAALFAGVRIAAISEASCTATVAYSWRSKNPFRSTYFACLAMAAELSTGALAMGAIQNTAPNVSMLLVKMDGGFFKKAAGLTQFTCHEGAAIAAAVLAAHRSGQAQTVLVHSTGQNVAGETVAGFSFTWSFKLRGGR